MRAIVLAVVMLISSGATAQGVTPLFGCFVEQSTGLCGTKAIGCSLNSTENVLAFGTSVAGVCNALVSKGAELQVCIDDYNTLVDGFNALDAAHANIFGQLDAQKKLVNKLRRKCGKTCKGVK